MPPDFTAGNRAMINSGRHQGSMATVLKVAAKGCVTLSVDGAGGNGVGARACVPPESLTSHPKLTVRQLLQMSSPTTATERGSSNRRRRKPKLVRLPLDGGEPWSRGLMLPSYALSPTPPSDKRPLLVAHRDASGAPSATTRAPVIPSLFLPGFPKSATTWLHTCMGAAFTPGRAGCGADSNGWNASACPRWFLLSPMTASRWVRGSLLLEMRKETFFFGGSRQRRYRRDLLTLHGPDPARAPLAGAAAVREGEPTGELWPWESRRHWNSLLRNRPTNRPATGGPRADSAMTVAQNAALMRRLGRLCSGAQPPCANPVLSARGSGRPPAGRGRGGRRRAAAEDDRATIREAIAEKRLGLDLPISDCTHPACHRTIRDVAETRNPSCAWEDELVGRRLGRNDSYCLNSVLPWVAHPSQSVAHPAQRPCTAPLHRAPSQRPFTVPLHSAPLTARRPVLGPRDTPRAPTAAPRPTSALASCDHRVMRRWSSRRRRTASDGCACACPRACACACATSHGLRWLQGTRWAAQTAWIHAGHARAYRYRMVVADFTPNYLCDAEALPRLHRSSDRPEAMRFIVVSGRAFPCMPTARPTPSCTPTSHGQ